MSFDTPPKYSGIIQYKVKETWKDYEVTLEVNHDILTEEVATLINQFWSDNESRLAAEDGDVIRTVIRLFGSSLIHEMLSANGANFSSKAGLAGDWWTGRLQTREGWGGLQDYNHYGFCGIRVVAADVETLGFDDVEIEAIGDA